MAKKEHAKEQKEEQAAAPAQGQAKELRFHKQGEIFGVKLVKPAADILKRYERRYKPVAEVVGGDLYEPVVAYTNDSRQPTIAVAEEPPDPVALHMEVLRLDFRRGLRESDLPPAELAVASNQHMAHRLYRSVEEELLHPKLEEWGQGSRAWRKEAVQRSLVEPLEKGNYKTDKGPLRIREGALEVVAYCIAETDTMAVKRFLQKIGELDPELCRMAGVMVTAIGTQRPFDEPIKVTMAYGISCPFLFERKPLAPATS